jgi:hypothetical protein
MRRRRRRFERDTSMRHYGKQLKKKHFAKSFYDTEM